MIATIPYSDRNLILTGYIGPNQLIVVRRISERLSMPLVNFEARLEERAELPLDEIRIRFGEARLKTLQAEVIQEIVLHRGAVIYINGETVAAGDNLARLAETGLVLCLVATVDAVLQRLHLALGARYHNPSERAIALGQLKRNWAVRKLSGVRELDTSAMHEAEIVDAVVGLWREEALLARG